MKIKYIKFIIILLILGLAPILSIKAQSLTERLEGMVLLQVEQNGEAWYVNPDNGKRYYMGRPRDAFYMIWSLGLGIKHDELENYLNSTFPKRLSGKIVLDVELNGEAYYIYPNDLKGYYLGRPISVFNVMRNLGLGITDRDLNEIEMANDEIKIHRCKESLPRIKNDAMLCNCEQDENCMCRLTKGSMDSEEHELVYNKKFDTCFYMENYDLNGVYSVDVTNTSNNSLILSYGEFEDSYDFNENCYGTYYVLDYNYFKDESYGDKVVSSGCNDLETRDFLFEKLKELGFYYFKYFPEDRFINFISP